MTKYIFVLIIFLSILSCGENRDYAFQSIPDAGLAKSLIEAEEAGFFILRYRAFAECDLGGTGTEIVIRNNSDKALVIEQIELYMSEGQVDLLSEDSPKIYKTIGSVVQQGDTQIPELRPLEKNEWLNFRFSLNDCASVNYDTELEFYFHIALRAGEKRYENKAHFTKMVKSSPMAWL